MRTIINYIRSCFCKHEWELLEQANVFHEFTKFEIGTKWTYRCKKCGCMEIYKNY